MHIRIWQDTAWNYSKVQGADISETVFGFDSEEEAHKASGARSWKPVVKVFGEGSKWHDNGLRFATKAEALANAKDLGGRWMMVSDHDAQPSLDPVNYRWDPVKGLVAI
jgi:hypothetical protein